MTSPLSTIVLADDDVRRLLPPDECIELMEQTLRALASGEFHQPLRSVERAQGTTSMLGLMPAHRAGDGGGWAVKVLCLVPDNRARGLDTHQGIVVLFDVQTGRVRTIANASAVTEIRTAAVSAVSARALARPDARVLAVVGAGVQARSHLRALTAAHDYEEIRVASRTRAQVEEVAALHPRAAAVGDVESAVRGADVVVTVTSSREPVLRREWLADGAHLIAVGSSVPTARELDGATVAAATLFVDRRESAETESGDYRMALEEGLIGPGHIAAELGEVLLGDHPGRTSREELTLFESLGLGAEDLAAAAALDRAARELGAGLAVEL